MKHFFFFYRIKIASYTSQIHCIKIKLYFNNSDKIMKLNRFLYDLLCSFHAVQLQWTMVCIHVYIWLVCNVKLS